MESVSTVKSDDPSPGIRLAFVGGGSGGHLFPAVAVSDAVIKLHGDARFLFLISHRPIDARLLATAEWLSDCAQIQPYFRMPQRDGILCQVGRIPQWLNAYRVAKDALRKFRPHVAVGVGAAASVPGMLAARTLGIPLALMEQNTVPGKATRLLSRRVTITLAGMPFEDAVARRWPGTLQVTGTPIRPAISELWHRDTRPAQRCRLLILGGSQGSASVNRLILEAFADENCVPSDWEIIHQTGESQVRQIAAEYARRGRTATVLPFLPNLPELLATAALVVSRSGAGTLQELACGGVPSILIPFSQAAANHQFANARLLEENGAAVIVDETEDNAGLQLRHRLNELIRDPQLRQRYRTQIRCFAHPDAAAVSAGIVCRLAGFTS